MGGTSFEAIEAVRRATSRRLTAAGGITTRQEIDRLDAMGVDAVVGMAIYTGTLRSEPQTAEPWGRSHRPNQHEEAALRFRPICARHPGGRWCSGDFGRTTWRPSTVSRTVKIEPGGTVRLRSFSGRVSISADGRQRGRRERRPARVTRAARSHQARCSRRRLERSTSTPIIANPPGGRWRNNVVETDFDIKVPRRVDLDVSVFSASVTVQGVARGLPRQRVLVRDHARGCRRRRQGAHVQRIGRNPGERLARPGRGRRHVQRQHHDAGARSGARAGDLQLVQRTSQLGPAAHASRTAAADRSRPILAPTPRVAGGSGSRRSAEA